MRTDYVWNLATGRKTPVPSSSHDIPPSNWKTGHEINHWAGRSDLPEMLAISTFAGRPAAWCIGQERGKAPTTPGPCIEWQSEVRERSFKAGFPYCKCLLLRRQGEYVGLVKTVMGGVMGCPLGNLYLCEHSGTGASHHGAHLDLINRSLPRREKSKLCLAQMGTVNGIN